VRSTVALVVLVLGCDRRAPFDVAVMTKQLGAAGYTVTPAPVPLALVPLRAKHGVTDVSCIDARKAASTDTFCVIRCASLRAAGDVLGHTGESYGDWQRGPSVIVHERCGGSMSPAGFDCAPARRAIGE
jgi:hypothetical protein